MTFDKTAIREWVEVHSWQEAYELGNKIHSKSILKSTRYLGGTKITLQAEGIQEMDQEAKDNTISRIVRILKNRIYEFGLMESTVRPSEKRIEVSVPGFIDQETARKMIGRTALLKFQNVLKSGSPGGSLAAKNLSQEVIYGRKSEDGQRIPYLVQKTPLITGSILKNVEVKKSQSATNPIYVSLEFHTEGSKEFADVITDLKPDKDRIAIVVDGIVQTAPVISQGIWDTAKNSDSISGVTIEGDFTTEEAKRLAIVLRAGSLPVQINVVEQKDIGKDLSGAAFGKDTIRASVTLYTPLLTWIEQNYKGEIRFWSQEKIKEEYQETVTPPKDGVRFHIKIKTRNKAELQKENLRFVLESENGNKWETDRIEFGEIKKRKSMGGTIYERGADVWFNFADNKRPSWLELTLYIVRMDIIGRDKIIWTFYGIKN